MSLAWVLDGSSRHEVSSKQHLLQIMNNGSLYTDTGSSPVDYLSSSYIQTADIDLAGETVIPIGTETSPFAGAYDGGNFKISNWSFTGTLNDSGLFGYCSLVTLCNMVLSGVWQIDTSASTAKCGFLAARIIATSLTVRSFIYNISTEFETGTSYASGNAPNFGNGVLIADTRYCTAEGITLGGTITTCTSTGNLGGVLGYFLQGTLFMIRNIATFENNLVGQTCGGVASHARFSTSSFLMNAMTGDIVASRASGGVVGNFEANSPDYVDVVVNSMTGNVTGTGSAICFQTISVGPFTRFMSYMKGDVNNGICIQPRTAITNSIVAINGTVTDVGNSTTSGGISSDASFGMIVTGTDHSNASNVLSGYTYNPEFGDLPYVPFIGTDMGGTTHNWEFIFPNVSGKAAYSAFSDITITTGPTISAPIGVQFDLPESNVTEYVSFFKQATSEVYVDDSLTVLDSSAAFVFDSTGTNQKFPPTLGMDLFCVLADFSWPPLEGASWYTLTYEKDGGNEIELASMMTEVNATLFGVEPAASYEVFLYSDLSPSIPVLSVSGVAPDVNTASVEILLQRLENDLTILPLDSIILIDGDLGGALSTGDMVTTRRGDASFVANADTIAIINQSDIFLTSFSEDAGSGQNITVTLPDSSSSVISYNETNDSLTFDSTEYDVGSQFAIGNFKVKVQNL